MSEADDDIAPAGEAKCCQLPLRCAAHQLTRSLSNFAGASESSTLAHAAVLSGNLELLTQLLNEKPELIRSTDQVGRRTPCAAALTGDVYLTRVDEINRFPRLQKGRTPLHAAAKESFIPGLSLLLEKGARLDAGDRVRPVRAYPDPLLPRAGVPPATTTSLRCSPDAQTDDCSCLAPCSTIARRCTLPPGTAAVRPARSSWRRMRALWPETRRASPEAD